MTSDSRVFLDSSRRKLIQTVALVLTLGCATITAIAAALLLVLPNRTMLLTYLSILIFALIGSSLTLVLIRRRALGTAMLPLLFAMMGGVVLSSRLIPETTLVSVPLLAIVILLIQLSQRRLLTISIGSVCVLMAAVLAATAPRTQVDTTALSIGEALPAVYAVGAITLIVVIWLVANHLIATANAAVRLADERAQDAEEARASAEAMTHSLEVRTAEQAQLLNLVSALETPVISLADNVLLAPLVGQMSKERLDRITQAILSAVYRQQTNLVILDIAGLPVLDTHVAHALVGTAMALKLLGCTSCISGVSASVAMTLSGLDVQLDHLLFAPSAHEALQKVRQAAASDSLSRAVAA